jgi:hypothetical protein
VQILVSPLVLPDARNFGSLIGLYSSPDRSGASVRPSAFVATDFSRRPAAPSMA